MTIDGQQHVAGRHTSTGRGACGVLNQQAIGHPGCSQFIGLQWPQREPQACRCCVGVAGHHVSGFVIRIAELGLNRFGRSLAPDVQCDLVAGGGHADDGGQVARRHHRLAVHLADHVSGLQACLVCRATFLNRGDQSTFGFVQLEGVGQYLVNFLHRHAQARVFDLAVRDDLVLDLAGQVNRNGK